MASCQQTPKVGSSCDLPWDQAVSAKHLVRLFHLQYLWTWSVTAVLVSDCAVLVDLVLYHSTRVSTGTCTTPVLWHC